MKRLFFLSTFLSVFLLYQPKTFGQYSFPNNTLTLDSIQLNEIFSEGSNQVDDGRIQTNSINPPLPTPSLTTQVSRTVEKIWQLELSGTQDENQISVAYDLISGKNNPDRLSNEKDSNEINVSITPIAPVIDPNAAKRILYGGAIFNLDLSNIKTSGSYSGKLMITFTGI
ncbi:hypothetical protein LC593_28140 [Nostoc sp. CHAB 5844]|nr:hypothetical protein [Nostoc sp. CHAB 5844]